MNSKIEKTKSDSKVMILERRVRLSKPHRGLVRRFWTDGDSIIRGSQPRFTWAKTLIGRI